MLQSPHRLFNSTLDCICATVASAVRQDGCHAHACVRMQTFMQTSQRVPTSEACLPCNLLDNPRCSFLSSIHAHADRRPAPLPASGPSLPCDSAPLPPCASPPPRGYPSPPSASPGLVVVRPGPVPDLCPPAHAEALPPGAPHLRSARLAAAARAF